MKTYHPLRIVKLYTIYEDLYESNNEVSDETDESYYENENRNEYDPNILPINLSESSSSGDYTLKELSSEISEDCSSNDS